MRKSQPLVSRTGKIGNALVVQLTSLPPFAEELLRNNYEVIRCDAADIEARGLGEHASRVVATVSTARGGLRASTLEYLPNLKVVSCFSSGTEGIDRAAAEARGIPVFTTGDIIAEEVADLAMGLAISLARRLVEADAYVRAGRWRDGSMPLGTSLTGKTLGIVGLGRIGMAIATRAAAFGMTCRYFGPRRKQAVPYTYCESVEELAARSDFLVLCCPENAETENLVTMPVLSALGERGFLVNVARGRIVNQQDLIDALSAHVIAGAGLDAYVDEPRVAAELVALRNTVLLPHIGAGTTEIREKMARLMVGNICRVLGV